MKRLFYAFALLSLMGLFLISCSSTNSVSEEILPVATIPVEQVTVEATVVPEETLDISTENFETSPSSIAQLLPLKRQVETDGYSKEIVIMNYTGYEITVLDIFSDSMYEENTDLSNLLTYGIEDYGSTTIPLDWYPQLAQALSAQTEEIFHVNAMDSEGSSYYKEWQPLIDEWEIELQYNDRNYYPTTEETVLAGESILVSNNSFYTFEQLYIRNKTMTQEQEFGPNLLGFDFLPGHTVRIDIKDIPWVDPAQESSFLFVAFDNEGDFYTHEWEPQDFNWHIDLTIDDLNVLPNAKFLPPKATLTITNNTGKELWYVYLPTESMAAGNDLGDDLLVIDVFPAGNSRQFDLAYFPRTFEAYRASEEPLFKLIVYDSDDSEYNQLWNPTTDGWEIILTPNDLIVE
ncbi:MAG: hypothetical protein RBQ79_07245 [Sphaerochaetaceae bacterium]|jgi:hypothetical protein|nr:hypothetical protein [Sphaerochaetaceae bacterium]